MARMANATVQPSRVPGSSSPTPIIVTPVSRNPAAVCNARAEPAVPGGASSLTAVENCAESATTVMPHTTSTVSTMAVGAPNRKPTTMALEPESAMAVIVTVVRPSRSANAPAPMQPTAPEATTRKATPLAAAGGTSPDSASVAATKTGTQVHMAYSSHMWPR